MKNSKIKWNLDYVAVDNFAKELDNFEKSSNKFIDKWHNNKKYLTDQNTLLTALDEYEEWVKVWNGGGKMAYYWGLRLELEQNNPDIKAKNNQIEEIDVKMVNRMRFFEHQLAKIPVAQQKIFLDDKGLGKYKHYLERLFDEAKYLLSEAEENILSLKDKPARQNWISMTNELLTNELIGGKTMEVLINEMRDKNSKVRDKAAKNFNQLLAKYENVAEIEINSILEDKKINDNLRKFDTPDKQRHVNDDIESEVVDSLVEAVGSHNYVAGKFYRLKADLLGLAKLKYHERNISYGKIDKKYTFSEGVELLSEVFYQIEPEFGDILKNFIDQGLVDVYPDKGKHAGAFCAGFSRILPTYILLNWTDSFRDVTTLAHEAGHGINNELMKSKQHSLSWGTPTSTAEVASTFFEDFVIEKMAEKEDEEMRLAIMMTKLDGDIQSIWRQVACYRFEQQLHHEFRKQGYLSKKTIGEMFQKEMALYVGEAVEKSNGSQNWWIYWSHIRRYFYVYSYASGQLMAKSMQNYYKRDRRFIEKVKMFLSAGTSAAPKDIFMNLGIDITDKQFWITGIKETEELLEKTIMLAKKLGKIRGDGI